MEEKLLSNDKKYRKYWKPKEEEARGNARNSVSSIPSASSDNDVSSIFQLPLPYFYLSMYRSRKQEMSITVRTLRPNCKSYRKVSIAFLYSLNLVLQGLKRN